MSSGYISTTSQSPTLTKADVHNDLNDIKMSDRHSSDTISGEHTYRCFDQLKNESESCDNLMFDNRLKSKSNVSNDYTEYKKNINYGNNNYAWRGKKMSDVSERFVKSSYELSDNCDASSIHSLPVKSLKVSPSDVNYHMPRHHGRSGEKQLDDVNRPFDSTQNSDRRCYGNTQYSQWKAFSDTSSSCSLPPYTEQAQKRCNSTENIVNLSGSSSQLSVKSSEIINCRICGQFHKAGETHLYDYYQPVNDDVICRICGQPLVGPLDTKCGHTFCARCLQIYLKSQSTCIVCGLPVVYKGCQPSSTIVQRLLDKLLVVCPNVDYCEEVLQRCDLDSHLRLHCRGAITKCPHTDKGCIFSGPRSALSSHLWECSHKTPPKGRKPILDGHITKISLDQGECDLGVSVVGGSDTPLTCIVIQEVLVGGAVAQDGRLMQGDMLLEINGEELTQAGHYHAVKLLSQRHHMCRLTVYREKSSSTPPLVKDEIFKVIFSKEKNPQLGIKLISKRSGQGVFILGLIPGGQAEVDGQIQPDDRVIEINGHNLTHGTQEQAAFLIQKSPDLVEIIISRITRPDTPDLIRCISQYSNYNEVLDIKPEFSQLLGSNRCMEKFITAKKEPKETLGLSIAGGVGSPRGDTPIYVTNINPGGCFGRNKQLNRGDILLSINGTSLYGLSHADAVSVLKSQVDIISVSLRILTSPESQPHLDETGHFTPSWFYWLQLPEVYQSLHVITLQRSPTGSFGFSIVGGTDSCHGSIPIYIKSVVVDTPACKDGRLRCGDMILSVNDTKLKGLTHDEAVGVLKQAPTTVTITVVSWPGSIV